MFGKGVKLFSLFGFEVRLDWSWIIIAGLVTWTLADGLFPYYIPGLSRGTYWWMGAAGAVGLFISIILHEMGHSLVARNFGIPMKGITLFVFGGVAQMGGEPPNAKSEFFMAIAGPLVSLFLAAIFYGFKAWAAASLWPTPAVGILSYLAWINLLLLAFNLIPAFPLDGGRVLRSILWGWKKNLRWATRIAAGIGIGFAYLLMAGGVVSFIFGNFIGGIWWFLIGIFIRYASRISYEQVVLRQALAGEPVRRFMTPNVVTVPPSLTVKSLVEDYLYKYPYKMFPVVQDHHLVGCVSMDQVKQVPREEWEYRTAQTLASSCSPENTITPDADATKALSAMSRANLTRLMVVDHGELVGIIALRDLLNYLSRKMELERV